MGLFSKVDCAAVIDGVYTMAHLVNPEDYEGDSKLVRITPYDSKATIEVARAKIVQWYPEQ